MFTTMDGLQVQLIFILELQFSIQTKGAYEATRNVTRDKLCLSL